jgi:ketosteroid isomerase-like protein
MVEKRYFASVDRKDMTPVLDCFCEDAVFTIQSAFSVHEGRDTGIKKMFEEYFENFTWGYTKSLSTSYIPSVNVAPLSSMWRLRPLMGQKPV